VNRRARGQLPARHVCRHMQVKQGRLLATQRRLGSRQTRAVALTVDEGPQVGSQVLLAGKQGVHLLLLLLPVVLHLGANRCREQGAQSAAGGHPDSMKYNQAYLQSTDGRAGRPPRSFLLQDLTADPVLCCCFCF
jgi:hypothetical protein